MYRVLTDQLTRQFNVPEGELTPETTLSDTGLDSLALLELITILQNEYQELLSLDDADAPGLNSTLGEVAGWLERTFHTDANRAPAAAAEQGTP